MTPEYVDASDLIQPDTRSAAQKWLDAEMDKRWANEQGAEPYPILESIALEVIEEHQRLRAQIGQGVPDGWQLMLTQRLKNVKNLVDRGLLVEGAKVLDDLIASAPPGDILRASHKAGVIKPANTSIKPSEGTATLATSANTG